MAKRRNLKKEKAQRNLAYARQFRKKPTHFQSKYKRYSGLNNEDETRDENGEKINDNDN